MELVDLARLRGSCQTCNRAELCLPRGISHADLEKLFALERRSKMLSKGGLLFRAGAPLDSLYLVRSGSLKITMVGDSGDEQILGFFLPGELLGLDALSTQQHTCTANALELSNVCVLPYQQLTKFCQQVPALQRSLMRLIGREISAEQELLLNINRRQALGRVAAFLLSLSHRYRRLGYSSNEFRLSMSRQDLGNYLGLTIETVSRAVSRLQQSGLIAVERRFIRILQLEALNDVCHGEQDDPLSQHARA